MLAFARYFTIWGYKICFERSGLHVFRFREFGLLDRFGCVDFGGFSCLLVAEVRI